MGTRAAIIGCGKRGQLHARGLATVEGVEIVGCADPAQDLANAFAREHGGKAFYETRAMLDALQPEVVALCTRPRVRLNPLSQCVEAGVRAVQSEKPMAVSWDEARQMHKLCVDKGVQLTFTHQRRFRGDFARARELIAGGAIGQVIQLEGYCPNMYDWGTHWFDMFFFLLGDIRASWVLGQMDRSEPKQVFDAPVDGRGISSVMYESGARGVLITGDGDGKDTGVRAVGTEGLIEIYPPADVPFRMLRGRGGSGWEDLGPALPAGSTDHAKAVAASLRHTVECLRSGATPLHGSANALKATELIFATYASARLSARVDLPMEGNPELTLDRLLAP